MKKNMKSQTGLEIAVIGMAGRFPGAGGIGAFWENLAAGVEGISFFSREELVEAGVDESQLDNPGYVKARGCVEGKEFFDSGFFGYLPVEAREMDPQIRLFHQCVWHGLENAGYNPFDYKGLIGLYAGAGANFNWEAHSMISSYGKPSDLDSFTAGMLRNKDFITSRISYKLNLNGPAVFMHTACSTSLVAIHTACKSLLLGECSMAVAGGVTLTDTLKSGYMYREGMIAAPDGHNRAFDALAQGTVRSEGAGVVVLKKLKNAMADGDFIYAVVKGSAINNDGLRKAGYTAVSVDGQAEAIRIALKMARVEPESIASVEAHGTATPLGDPIEVEALKVLFSVTVNIFGPKNFRGGAVYALVL